MKRVELEMTKYREIEQLSQKNPLKYAAPFIKNAFNLKISAPFSCELTIEKIDDDLQFHVKGDENSLETKLLRAILFIAVSRKMTLDLNAYELLSFREVENMMRDKNSVAVVPTEIFEDCEKSFLKLKRILRYIDGFNSYLKKFPAPEDLCSSDFLSQLKTLSDYRSGFSEVVDLPEVNLPRLDSWFPGSGELVFAVGEKTLLGDLEGKFIIQFFHQIEAVRVIKMVASK